MASQRSSLISRVGGNQVVFDHIGAALLVGRRGPLLMFPVLVALVQRTVVEREESYLARCVGESYRQYQTRVPRWL